MSFDYSSARTACFTILVFVLSANAAADDGSEPHGELTLAQAVGAALARNPELLSGEYELQAAVARVTQAGVRPNPEMGVALENFGGGGGAHGTHLLESTLTLSQVLELGGQRSRRMEAARSGHDTAIIDREIRQLDVLVELTRRFITVVADQEQLAMAEHATELAQKTLSTITVRVQAARSPEAEKNRATIEVAHAVLERQRAEDELQSARLKLAAMWGSTEPAYESAHADLYSAPAAAPFEELVQRLRRNPDLMRFAAENRLRESELRLAQVQATPNVTIGAGVRRFQETGDSALLVNLAVPLPVFDRNQGNIQEADAKRSRIAFDERAAYVEARSVLFELYQDFQATQRETRALRETIIPQAEQALAQTESGYQRGRFSYLELVNVQRELVDSQRSAIKAAANAHRLAAEIERLTGEPLTPAPK